MTGSFVLFIGGVVVLVFGLWVVSTSRDPLGYTPNGVWLIPLAGLVMVLGGIVWRFA